MSKKTTALEFVKEGNRFQIARKMLGLTQQEFAKKAGVSFGSIRGYERGLNMPGMVQAQKIGAAGINMNYVATGEGPPIFSDEMYPKPTKIVSAPSKENPALRVHKQVDYDYVLEDDEYEIDDIEKRLIQRRLVLENLNLTLEKIRFTSAHELLKDTVVELIFNNAMNMNAAEAMLVLFRDEQEWHEELLENERKKHGQK